MAAPRRPAPGHEAKQRLPTPATRYRTRSVSLTWVAADKTEHDGFFLAPLETVHRPHLHPRMFWAQKLLQQVNLPLPPGLWEG